MNDKIQFIRQKCIEANPEAKERVWHFDPVDFVDFREGQVFGVPAYFQYWLVKLTEMNAAIRLWEQGIKPGGKGQTEVRVFEHRPIRLADVLLAIDDKPNAVGCLVGVCFNVFGVGLPCLAEYGS